MSKEHILQNLNLKPLNILSIAEMKHTIEKKLETWACETEIANTKCKVKIFSQKEYIQIFIIPYFKVKYKTTWLKKVNQVNGYSMGLGAWCYLDEDSNTLGLKTAMGDVEMSPPEYVIRLLNNSILEIPKMLEQLLAEDKR